MANTRIQIKRTSTTGRTPNTTSSGNSQYINTGELALNLTDRKLFCSDGTNPAFEIGSNLNSLSVVTTVSSGNVNVTGYLNASANVVTPTLYGNVVATTLNASSNVITTNVYATTVTANLVGATANLSTSVNSALLTVGSSFIANTTGAYHTGTVNAASHTVGTTFTANATLVNAAAINVTGQVNTATFFASTSANVGANLQLTTSSFSISNSTYNYNANALGGIFSTAAGFNKFISNTNGWRIEGVGASFSSANSSYIGFGNGGKWVYDSSSGATTLTMDDATYGNTSLTINGLTFYTFDGYGTPTGSYTNFGSGNYYNAVVSYYKDSGSGFTYNSSLGATQIAFGSPGKLNLAAMYIDTPYSPTGTYNTGQIDLFRYSATNVGNKDKGMSVVSDSITAYSYNAGGASSTIYVANGSGFYHTGTVNAASHTTTTTVSNTSGFYPTSNTLALGNTIGRWIITANTITANGLTVSGGNLNAATVYATGLVNAANFTTTGTVNTATVYATGLVNAANFNTTGYVNTGTFTAATSANVGANVQLTTTAAALGNSTVNTVLTSSALTISSPAGQAALQGGFGATYATLELGGSAGAFIDLKTPYTDDYDARIMSDSSGLTITGGSSTASANLINLAAANVTVASGTLFVDQVNGRVGIKTTSPSAPFEIQGGGATAYTAKFATGPGSPFLAVMPNASAGAYNSLVQAGDTLLNFTHGTANTGNLVIGAWFNAGGGGIRMRADINDITFTANSFAFNTGNTNFNSGRLFVDAVNGGSAVGIGTTTPFSAAGYGWLTLNGTSGGILTNLVNGTENFRIQSWSGGTDINQITALPILFKTTNAERMRLDAGGNVAIGTTTTSGATLTVAGTVNANGLTVSGGTITSGNVNVTGYVNASANVITPTLYGNVVATTLNASSNVITTNVYATLVSANLSAGYANITGQVNTGTLYVSTTANIAGLLNAAAGFVVTGIANVSSNLNIGAFGTTNGVNIQNTSIIVGNSTANATLSYNLVRLRDSSGANISLSAGVGGSSTLNIGNNSANVTLSAAAAGGLTLAGNTLINPSVYIGANSTSFTQIYQDSLYITSGVNGLAETSSEISFGNSTVSNIIDINATLTSTPYISIAANTTANAFIANTLGTYHTGTVNAASHTVGTTFTANATLVNAAAINITGQVNTATFYAATSANVGTAVVANATGVYTTGTINAASHTVGSSFIANSTGTYHTGTVNAASHTVGTTFTANATLVNAAAINITGQVNTATFYAATSANVGSNTLTLGTSSISANGYSRLPNGLLMQWGNFLANSTTASVNFPTTFTALYSAQVSAVNSTYSSTFSAQITAISTSAITVKTANATNTLLYWSAIGT